MKKKLAFFLIILGCSVSILFLKKSTLIIAPQNLSTSNIATRSEPPSNASQKNLIKPASNIISLPPGQTKDRYIHQTVLSSVELENPEANHMTRLKVVRSDDRSIPYLLVKEEFETDKKPPLLKSQVAMAASHALVELNSTATADDLERISQKYGAFVKKQLVYSQLYIVEIKNYSGNDPQLLNQLIENLKAESIIKSTHPNYITYAE